MKSFCFVILVFGFASLLKAAEIRDGLLYADSLRSPVFLTSIDKVEFVFDRIDESLAGNPQELEYIRLRNDEELWVKSKRYAVVGSQRIPVTLDQEFQIMIAKLRDGHEASASASDEAPEEAPDTVAAVNSLQIESIEKSNADIIKHVRDRLARFEQKTFAVTTKKTEVRRSDVPKSLSLWRAIIDNQNVYLSDSPDSIVLLPSERTLRVTARDPQLCNLPTVKPPSNPNLLFFELRNGSTTYWAQTTTVSYDPMLKYFITATPGGQTLCFNDRIMRSGFEDGEFGPR